MKDRGTRDSLVEEHLPLCRRLHERFVKRHRVAYCEARLWSAAMKGLWDVAETYDPAKGPFERYAKKRIKGEMSDELEQERRYWNGGKAAGFEAVEDIEDESTALLDSGADPIECLDRLTGGFMAGAVLGFAGELLRTRGEEGIVLCETRRRFLEATEEILATFDPEDRALLDLRHAQGLPWEVIVSILGVPERTLKRRAGRLRDHLELAVRARAGRALISWRGGLHADEAMPT